MTAWSLLVLAALGCGRRAEPEPEPTTPREAPRPSPKERPPPTGRFRVNDVAVGEATVDLRDPEFDDRGRRFVWTEADGRKVWVGHLDHKTGELAPPDGRGELVLEGASPIDVAHNGPELVRTARGTEVVYSRPVDGGHVLVRAWRERGGWRAEDVPGPVPGRGPIGALDPPPGEALVLYARLAGAEGEAKLSWLDLDDPTRAGPTRLDSASRWVPGRRALIGADVRRKASQVVVEDLDSGEITPVSGPLQTVPRYPFCWRAPERDGGLACWYRHERDADDPGTELRVFGETDDGEFERVTLVRPPADLPWIASPEPFVHDGRSWAIFVAEAAADGAPEGYVYVASVFDDAVLRRVSTDEPRNRRDPEIYLGGQRPWAFFVVIEPGGRRVLHRASTGL